MILIVSAHHEPRSFNHAMVDVAARTLRDAGREVIVSDLYAMDFPASASRADFQEVRGAEMFGYAREQYYAQRTSTFAEPIAGEIAKLKACDTLILQFPLWWFGMPAILKGWIDKVFANGVAYGGSTGQFFERGMMAGKRAMVVTTTGAPDVMFKPSGMCGAMEAALWPIHNGMLRFVGFDVLAPHVIHGVDIRDREALDGELGAYAARLRGLDDEAPLFFHPWSDYAPDLLLKPGLEARTVGQTTRTQAEYDAARAAERADAPVSEEAFEGDEMTAYMTVILTVTDTAWIGEYVKNVPPIMEKYGGRPVTVSGPVEVLEGEDQPSQIAVFAFPDHDKLAAFMADPDYKPWKEARQAGSTASIFAFNSVK